MNSPIANIAQPKYLHLAQTLFNEIQSGVYKVGSRLPTEEELCTQFGVSRFTAREALKRLLHLGIVSRQAGIGTTVISKSVQSAYRQNIATVNDLYQYASETSLKILEKETQAISTATAEALNAVKGEVWLHLLGMRYAPDNSLPIAQTEIWICPAFRSVKGLTGSLHRAVHSFIEDQFGESIATVEQDIDAVRLDKKTASALLAEPRSIGLKITRRYRNRRGDLVEYASSIHTADRFSHRSIFQREWGVDARDM